MDAEGTEAPAVAAWQSPGGVVEELVLGTREEAAIDAAVDAFCRTHLAAAVGEVLFRATSVEKIVASDRRAVPRRRAASRSATTTAWAVGSFVSATRS
jgi:hypothetical protein